MMYVFGAIVLILCGATWFRPSFRSQRSSDFLQTSPEFNLTTHLKGDLISEGVIYGPMGRVSSRFVAKMHGEWTNSAGTLSESFHYASGATQERKWFLKLGENGAFTATADDILGEAKGQQEGASVRLTYRIRLPEESGGHVLSVVDWMYLMENGTIINKSEMRKFGIKVAELIATMRPASV